MRVELRRAPTERATAATRGSTRAVRRCRIHGGQNARPLLSRGAAVMFFEPGLMSGAEAMFDLVDGAVIGLETETLRPLFGNRAVQALVGEPLDKWRAKPGSWRRLFDPEDWPRIARLCHAVARDGRRRRTRHI